MVLVKFATLALGMIAAPAICFATLITKDYGVGFAGLAVLTLFVCRVCDNY